jgi:hypothetical protein
LGNVVVKDLGWNGIKARLMGLHNSYTKVGLQEGSRDLQGGDLVMVGAANEFGTQSIPERSFMRSSFEENRPEILAITAAETKAVIEGRKQPIDSLRQMGEYMQGKIVKKIYSHPPPPNSPKTIEAKGSSGTLVDTGHMAQSIRHVEYMGGRLSPQVSAPTDGSAA